MGKPAWALQTLKQGAPNFATMKKYMDKGMSIKQLGAWMNATFSGRLNEEKIKPLREKKNRTKQNFFAHPHGQGAKGGRNFHGKMMGKNLNAELFDIQLTPVRIGRYHSTGYHWHSIDFQHCSL